MKPISLNTIEISELCKKHKVKNLYVFGSFLTSKFSKSSDIDLIVDFNKNEIIDYFDNYYNLKFSLEKILNHTVDLLENLSCPFYKVAAFHDLPFYLLKFSLTKFHFRQIEYVAPTDLSSSQD